MGYGNHDIIMTNILGCASMPDPTAKSVECTESEGMGYIAVAFFVMVKTIGVLVLVSQNV